MCCENSQRFPFAQVAVAIEVFRSKLADELETSPGGVGDAKGVG